MERHRSEATAGTKSAETSLPNEPLWTRTRRQIRLGYRPEWLFAGLVLALYLIGIFPYCFFRHDDWWILGNSVTHLGQDWGFLWRPTLYWQDTEIVWFFRPFFKLGTWLFFQLFAFQYYAWLTACLLLACWTLWVGYRTLQDLSGRLAAQTFLLWFVCAIPLHLGSLAWVGEGLMNVPQGLLLILCTSYWVRVGESGGLLSAPLAWSTLYFVLALGFKESTVFHLAFLAALTLSEPALKFRSRWRTWVPAFGAIAVVAGLYLVWRLGYLPWNPSYRPAFDAALWMDSLVRCVGALS